MRRSANTWRGSDAVLSTDPFDPAEEAGLYQWSVDEFLIETQSADGFWHGLLSGEADQPPSLHHQAGDMERFVVGTTGDEIDVIISLPGGDSTPLVAFGDAVEVRAGIAPDDTFGGGDSSGWMLTLLPSADWFDLPAPAADPWA